MAYDIVSAVVDKKGDKYHGVQGIVVAKEGEQSEVEGIVPDGHIEVEFNTIGNGIEHRIYKEKNLKIYD